MAVGYLEQDWRADFVKTTDRGKSFTFAAHNFATEAGGFIGVGFYDGEAFTLLHEEEDRVMYAYELIDFFNEMVEDEEDRSFDDEGDAYQTLIGEGGGLYEDDIDSYQLSNPSLLETFYEDIEKRYWR